MKNSSKVTPIGMEEEEEEGGDCNHPLSGRNKRISFKAKSSPNDRENVRKVSYYASLPVTFSPAHEDGDDNTSSAIKRERIIAKTASCPTQVFPPAMTSEELGQNDNRSAVKNSTRKLASGRRRALSMPTGTHDFFGDTDAHKRYSSAGVSIRRCKLEKVHENHIFLNGRTGHIEVKNHTLVDAGEESKVAKKEMMKTCTATTMAMKGESRDISQQNGTANAKCQCIIL